LRDGWSIEEFGDVPTGGIGSTKGTLKTAVNERRSVGRKKVVETALLFFGRRMITCGVRDLSRMGAGMRLQDVNVLPADFELTFNNFTTIRKCRLVWRQGDFTGVSLDHERYGSPPPLLEGQA
jgi:hypothetical protein